MMGSSGNKSSGKLGLALSNQGAARVDHIMMVILSLLSVGLTACQTAPSVDAKSLSNINYSVGDGQNSGFKATDPDKIAEVRTRMAAQYIRDNELDAAQRQLEKAFSANNRYAPAYDMMGVLLQKEGSSVNLQKADSFFKKALAIDPDFMQARNNYGVYLSQVGRNEDALKQFELAGAALGYEGRIGALENLGRTALKVDNKTLATQAFVRALEGNRNSLVAHIELVDLLIDSNRIEQAQDLYDETLILLAKDANKIPRILLQGIKLAHAQNNRYTQEELSQQLLADFPLSEEATQLKGWIRNPEAPWK